jgi:hypothetical protein
MPIKRPTKDTSTLVAEGLSNVLTGIQGRIKEENPVGFGQEEVSASDYKKKLLGMSKAEKMSEIDRHGIEAVTDALRE